MQHAADHREVVEVRPAGQHARPDGNEGPRRKTHGRLADVARRGDGRHEVVDLVGVAGARDVDDAAKSIDGDA